MKNVIIFFILIIGFQFMKAQSFQKTEKYRVVTEIKKNGTEHPTCIVNLVRLGGISENLSTLTINDTELFEDIFITTLENPGLDGVSEVIKMEVEYLACCAQVETYYFMVTNDNELVSLPQLTNIYCEDSNTDSQYTFPNQEYGIEGNILETETLYKETSEIKYVNLKQSFTWNDNKVNSPKNTAITSY
ncbi:hypothetical protein [Aquimarina sp. 2201CG14-23]|uniref:hypothetical protein n=1 Tax=Aquimarina mycalae TaxID=3040073 RepID=UPI002477E696|nr:hypothetical protein [Aquimarina sp. 2201CG14-23]MDH7447659.1 hypothetical protein [Aquimarina sp. 2201CG14-23]